MAGPLQSIVVLDLTACRWSRATQVFADYSADVIKIEEPSGGDDTRHWGPRSARRRGKDTSEAAYYLAANRGKRSVAIDLASVEGQALVRRLAASADDVIENFRSAALRDTRLATRSYRPLNARLIYLSISAFGRTVRVRRARGTTR
jgi:crotonobetainyl-CoA:carnitine CoA-transferase CaiB-like acyl-CoA transferase